MLAARISDLAGELMTWNGARGHKLLRRSLLGGGGLYGATKTKGVGRSELCLWRLGVYKFIHVEERM